MTVGGAAHLKRSHSTLSKDFNAAYRSLVREMYKEGGASGLVTEEELHKLEYYNTFSQKDFNLRNEQFLQNREQKILTKWEEQESHKMDGCTFTPELFTRSSKKNRNFSQFIKDQEKYSEYKSIKSA